MDESEFVSACILLGSREAKPTVPEVLPLAQTYRLMRPENACGGSLHIVLDDCNVADDHVEFCVKWAHEHDDPPGEALAGLLLRCSKTQRSKISAGYYEMPSL